MSLQPPFSSIVFIDPGIADWQSLATSVADGTEVVLLDPEKDGVKQIAEALTARTGVDAIHIVSHGRRARLELGLASLTLDGLDAYRSEWRTTGNALSATGDLLLYGCSVAEGEEGRTFLERLARYTGADVAASTNRTGAASSGGDWRLETAVGTIETPVLFFADTVFPEVLANRAPRLRAGGALDATFSGDGKLAIDFGGAADLGAGVALRSDGGILIAGSSSDYFALARCTQNGSVDTTFSADGKLTFAVSPAISFRKDGGHAIAALADGRMLVAGTSYMGLSTLTDFSLARLNADGGLDTSFSGDGRQTVDFGGAQDDARCLAVQADGRILVGGSRFVLNEGGFALARLNANGTLDTGFGGDGLVTGSGRETIYDMALQADGKLVVAGSLPGSVRREFFVARFRNDGSLDTSFGGDGIVTTDLGADAYGRAVAIQPDGKILVAGESLYAGYDFALVRYKADGSLDAGFGTGGKVITPVGTGDDYDYPTCMALQTDGRILVAGYSGSVADGDWDFALVRHNPDGSLDTTFSGDGKLITGNIAGNLDGYSDACADIVVQPDGSIVLVGSSGLGGGDSAMALARYLPGGIADQTATAYRAYSFTIPASTFYDPDAGDSLSYRATLSDGGPLPGWLGFDALNRRFTGNPTNQHLGPVVIKVTVTDRAGLSLADTFTLTVTANHNVVGTAAKDTLYGTTGADTLDGAGGADTLVGLGGNDTHVVDNAGDVVTEAAGGGTDLVKSAVTFSFNVAGREELENLTLTGTNAINGTGNAKANVLTGNGAANVLNGGAGSDRLSGGNGNDTLDGGTGADTLVGGTGNDTLVVDNAGDVLTEAASGGTDLVKSSVTFSFAVAGRAELENLTLTGTNAINGIGNAKANVLTGNGAANVLNGGAGNDRLVGGDGNDTLLGGAGADTLVGGLGADRFKFLKPTDAQDTLTDFNRTQADKLVFASPNFGALAVGTLAAARFRSNTTGLAGATDDRFIFETDTRILWYDPDGNASGSAPVAMAKLNVATLANTDILLAAS